MAENQKSGPTIYLLECEDDEPRVKLTPGKRFEVVTTTVVDSNLQAISEEEPAARPPRLCGSRTTCMALVEIAE